MRLARAAASIVVVVFQVALAAGACGVPMQWWWFSRTISRDTMNRRVVQAALMAGVAIVVLSRVGLVLAKWSGGTPWLVWCVVTFATVSLVLNLSTPSAGERAVWAPMALLLLASSTVVAILARPPDESRV